MESIGSTVHAIKTSANLRYLVVNIVVVAPKNAARPPRPLNIMTIKFCVHPLWQIPSVTSAASVVQILVVVPSLRSYVTLRLTPRPFVSWCQSLSR